MLYRGYKGYSPVCSIPKQTIDEETPFRDPLVPCRRPPAQRSSFAPRSLGCPAFCLVRSWRCRMSWSVWVWLLLGCLSVFPLNKYTICFSRLFCAPFDASDQTSQARSARLAQALAPSRGQRFTLHTGRSRTYFCSWPNGQTTGSRISKHGHNMEQLILSYLQALFYNTPKHYLNSNMTLGSPTKGCFLEWPSHPCNSAELARNNWAWIDCSAGANSIPGGVVPGVQDVCRAAGRFSIVVRTSRHVTFGLLAYCF